MRRWASGPLLTLVLLNPSTADVVKDNVLPTLVPRDKITKRERREKSA
ncbi:MAG: hypothetical protein ACLGIF_05720 [Actinomycetes bacterium]